LILIATLSPDGWNYGGKKYADFDSVCQKRVRKGSRPGHLGVVGKLPQQAIPVVQRDLLLDRALGRFLLKSRVRGRFPEGQCSRWFVEIGGLCQDDARLSEFSK
jgi:hypothetical protein